nr:UDP-glucose 4-epimerase-like [Penaeus vannamei]
MSKVEGLDTILVTGGAGFVGSTPLSWSWTPASTPTPKEGRDLPPVLERVQDLTGQTVTFHHLSILDREALKDVFLKHKVDAVIHFAALKAVGESVKRPLDYYHNNITGTATLLRVMGEVGVKRLVFSLVVHRLRPRQVLPDGRGAPDGPGRDQPLRQEQVRVRGNDEGFGQGGGEQKKINLMLLEMAYSTHMPYPY